MRVAGEDAERWSTHGTRTTCTDGTGVSEEAFGL
jgi:hypothetical protein